MLELELLNAVFRFPHLAPSERQDAPFCRLLAEKFAAFVNALQSKEVDGYKCRREDPLADDRVVPLGTFTEHELQSLRQASHRLLATARHKRGGVWYDPWLPMYGCALQRSMLSGTRMKLGVLFVDGWERTMHFLPTGECVHGAVPKTHHVQHCTDLDVTVEGEVMEAFQKEMAKAKQCSGSGRSAAANNPGHQKTPQFVAAALNRAVVSVVGRGVGVNSSLGPKGGTTDVGQHTGGRPRDTCWPLVQAVIDRNLCCGEGLMRKAMIMFKLSLLQSAVREAEALFGREDFEVKTGCDIVDNVFFMLQDIVKCTVDILDSEYDVVAVRDQCERLHLRIHAFLDTLNAKTAHCFTLPEHDVLKRLERSSTDIEVTSPSVAINGQGESNAERRDRAWRNLEGCNFLDGAPCNLEELLSWQSSNAAPSQYKDVLMMRTVEKFMFKKSLQLNYKEGDPVDLEEMHSLVTAYLRVSQKWNALCLQVEQRSRTMLVIWIAFCLSHQHCVREVPLVGHYKIALAWKDLKAAVLSDHTAIFALRQVAQYIRRWNLHAGEGPLFHLSKQEATFEFAEKFGNSYDNLTAIYKRDVKAWESHVQGMWSTIEQKKKKAARLRDEIYELNRRLRSKQNDLAEEKRHLLMLYPPGEYSKRFRTSTVKSQLERDVKRISSDIRQTEAQLKSTIAMPKYLVRPLPPAKGDALQIVFMVNMPRNLEILGNLCVTAQRALAPATATTEMTTLPSLSPTSWWQFYQQHAPTKAFTATSKVFTANPSPYSLPGHYGPNTIDKLSSVDQYKRQCIWNPTKDRTALTWNDLSGLKVNPFEAPPESIIDSFIETLPGSFHRLQWMNAWPGGDTRGNLVYSQLFQQPESFEKGSFIALGSLRAFPNQQYRKLLWALLEDILPWSDPGVCDIVRQSLYQVGDLSNADTPTLLWKTDMLEADDGMATFFAVLDCVSSKLKQTPRRLESIPLLSELAGYLSQFYSDANSIVTKFAVMARRWANDSVDGSANESAPRLVVIAYQQACILYGYAALAYSLMPWDDKAAQDVCELIVLFRNSFLCASIDLPTTNAMTHIEAKIAEMMSRNIGTLIEYVERQDTNAVLTALVGLVNKTAPKQLDWNRFSELRQQGNHFGSCYEAVDNLGTSHYAINLFSGCILTNGNAPGGLPAEIRNHDRFKTLFGRCNFEVISANGVLRTKRQFCDRLYGFALTADGDLFAEEIALSDSNEVGSTLQLCSLLWTKEFGELFPSRLSKLFSHWYWVERNFVLFRSKEAKCREVFYVATIEERNELSQCYKIPFIDKARPYEEILGNLQHYERFVWIEPPLQDIFHVLAKFEQEKYLEPLKTPEGTLKIELPRFKLTFCLNENMRFESMEHKGYALATNQQFDDFLPRFSRYLVLALLDESDTSRPAIRMLVPVGNVIESRAGYVDVSISDDPDCHVEVASYELHRRLDIFETETISARLQMAAVCACAGTNVPSKRLRMTGAEAAIQMLHGCRSGRPFTSTDRESLQTICRLSYREPAVKILASSLLAESDRLAFLYDGARTTNVAMSSADEKAAYEGMCTEKPQRNPLRAQFRSKVEGILLGDVKHSHQRPSAVAASLDPLPFGADYVASVESKLELFVEFTPNSTKYKELPLANSCSNAMSEAMLQELKVSWQCCHAQEMVGLAMQPELLLERFNDILNDVANHRNVMQKWLWDAFGKATSDVRDSLLALVNFLPTMTTSDIVLCAIHDESLHMLVPKLCETARSQFKQGCFRFMELCVLEDKLERLVWKAQRGADLSELQLIDELSNRRQWQPEAFPYWLAFEVEGRLQIRHEQYVVARHLIEAPGTVCQLNMGRGKTRVILPMLYLYFTQSRFQKVVRGHFLSSLLSEARQFMHRYLTASSAQLSIFEQPFHRQVALEDHQLELISDTLEELKLHGGIQVVAPEHRMSLELKRIELQGDAVKANLLDEILDNNQYIDVLDECDALLHHKYHLVYAVGVPIALCNGVERWKGAEALLRVVAGDEQHSPCVTAVLEQAHVSCYSPDYANRLGAYNGTRLNTVVESTKPLRRQLKEAIVSDLIDNAPFDLMWMNTLGVGEARDALVTAISDSSVSLAEAFGELLPKFAPYTSQLLALRGYVAFGVLEHCLEKRYRVDFGLPFPGTRPKKIAIPYRAADVPSERSEFSHPDVCILLTYIGYYHCGLKTCELRNAFKMLLRLDQSEQQREYGYWYDSVESGLDDDEREALCDVCHISLADARQFELLCKVYKYCMQTINFFLDTIVFPQDTQQYPQRLSRTSWNLAAGEHNIGFSGTNDNHRLLPLSVAQKEPDEPSLLGTNGKMVDKMLQVSRGYEVVAPSRADQIPWQCVLMCALNRKARALIDTGALLAGVANHDAAKWLLGRPAFDLEGVTYYDSRAEFNCWMIAEKARRIVMPLKGAAMQEKDTFVIFDEARSRGSDMKLLPDASAVLTLGPKLTKDKLMQGAGRMRQLGCNQTLWIVSFDEVAQGILQLSKRSKLSELTTVDILNWVVENTKAECIHGLLEWASKGIHFSKTQGDRDAELEDENWSLEVLYQEQLRADKIADVIKSKAHLCFEGIEDELARAICDRGHTYGLDDEVFVTSHTDECERELQVEEEAEEEREVEVARRSPAKEKTWNYSVMLTAQSVDDLNGIVNVHAMDAFIRQWLSPKDLASLNWSSAHLFGTENFFTTVVGRPGLDLLNEFLRVVDVLIVFNNGQVLLVSECEADHILELLWSTKNAEHVSIRFVNLSFACAGVDRDGAHTTFNSVQLSLGSKRHQYLNLLSAAACHLYNGETMFAEHQRAVVEPEQRNLLAPLHQRVSTLSNFVRSRGNSHKWTRSLLHELCCRMDLEDCS